MKTKITLILLLLFISAHSTAIDSVYKYRNEISNYFNKKLSFWDRNKIFVHPMDLFRYSVITIDKSKWHNWELDKKDTNITYYKEMEDSIVSLLKNNYLCSKYDFDTTDIYLNLIMQYVVEGKISIRFMERFPNDMLKRNRMKIENFLNSYIVSRKDYVLRGGNKDVAEIAALAGLNVYDYFFVPERDMEIIKRKYNADSLKAGMSLSELFAMNVSNELKFYVRDSLRRIPEYTLYGKYKNYDKNNLLKLPIDELLRKPLRFIDDDEINLFLAQRINYIPEGEKYSIYFMKINHLLEILYSDYNIKVDFPPYFIGGDILNSYDPEKYGGVSAKDMFIKNYLEYMEKYEKWLLQKFGKKLVKKPMSDDIEFYMEPREIRSR